MKRVLFLSNGHGEDLSASLLAKKLVDIGYKVDGLPIVGKGKKNPTSRYKNLSSYSALLINKI